MSTKITKFDRETARLIGDRVVAALGPLGKELGVVMKRGGGTFGEHTFTMKLEIGVVGDDGTVASRTAEAFKQLAPLYGLSVDDLGKTFRSGGDVYTITGLATRRTKRPLLASRGRSGKEYCFAVEDVKRLMAVAALGGGK